MADQDLALAAVLSSCWQHREQMGRLEMEGIVSQNPQHTPQFPLSPPCAWSGRTTQAATAENGVPVVTEEPKLRLAYLQRQRYQVCKFSHFTSLQLEEHLKT